jgi:hypothetical protein
MCKLSQIIRQSIPAMKCHAAKAGSSPRIYDVRDLDLISHRRSDGEMAYPLALPTLKEIWGRWRCGDDEIGCLRSSGEIILSLAKDSSMANQFAVVKRPTPA